MSTNLSAKNANDKNSFKIDFNCDLGQSFGVYKNEGEYDLLPFVSSVNISCGSHSGDPLTINESLKIAQDNYLAIGAHVGYPDIQGFGYRPMELKEDELESLIIYQIGALSAIAKSRSLVIEHVRPHGGMYKQMATDFSVAATIAKAVAKVNPWLILVGAAGENLSKAGEAANIRVAHEVFLDKVYNFDGSIDFNQNDVVNIDYSMLQLNNLVTKSALKNNEGGLSVVKFDTVHLNIKSAVSLQIAKNAREIVKEAYPVPVNKVMASGWV